MKKNTLETTTHLERDGLQEQLIELRDRRCPTRTQLVAQWLLDESSKLYCRWVKK